MKKLVDNDILSKINRKANMSEDVKKCQACGMPLTKDEEKGTNADGSKNEEYCVYCFKDGKKAAYCQSCAMPLTKDEEKGTEAGGAKSEDYCVYCMTEGKFNDERTLEEQIQFLADMDIDWKGPDGQPLSREQRVVAMKEYFPTLKRWKTTD